MDAQFSRTALLYGNEAVARLTDKRVAVFGLGGVGGATAETLVRGGVGNIDIIDDDRVCLTNLNRQIIALHSTIGEYKTDVCKARLLDINPRVNVTAHRMFYAADTYDTIDLSQFDYVIDAIDTVSAKIELAVRCASVGTPLIAAMGAGNKSDPTRFRVVDIFDTVNCPLARVMRRELRKRGVARLTVVWSDEPATTPAEELSCKVGCVCPPGTTRKCTERRSVPASNAFVPPVVGYIAAGYVLRELMGVAEEEIKK